MFWQGLTPEEITTCLKRVELQHGLSALAAPVSAAVTAAAEHSSSVAKTSWGGVLGSVLRRYGAVALVTALLAVGYTRFRQQALEQQLLRRFTEQTKRRSHRSAKVARLLAVVSDQQALYAQVRRCVW